MDRSTAHRLPAFYETLRVDVQPEDPDAPFFRAKASRDGLRILGRYSSGALRVWDADQGGLLWAGDLGLDSRSSLRGQVSWSPDAMWIAVVASEHTILVCDLGSEAEPLELGHQHTEWPELSWSPDSTRLLTWLPALHRPRPVSLAAVGRGEGREDGVARVWDVHQPERESLEMHHRGLRLRGVAWSPDGLRIATWCIRRPASDPRAKASGVWVWDGTVGGLGVPERELEHEGALVCHAAWSPDGLSLATICSSGLARVWQVAEAGASSWGFQELEHGSSVGLDLLHVSWSPDSRHLVTAPILAEEGARLGSARLDGTGKVLRAEATSQPPPPPRLWDLHAGSSWSLELPGEDLAFASGPWAPDSSRLLTLSRPGAPVASIWVWDAQPGTEPPLELHGLQDRALHEVAWSPDGAWIAAACADGTVLLLDSMRAALVQTLGQPWNRVDKHLAQGRTRGHGRGLRALPALRPAIGADLPGQAPGRRRRGRRRGGDHGRVPWL